MAQVVAVIDALSGVHPSLAVEIGTTIERSDAIAQHETRVTTDTAQLELGVLQEARATKALRNNVSSGIQFATSTEMTGTTAFESILVPNSHERR
ncbi:hypothetical protein CERSUDRAFT_100572 [Gelatoporia subvermispora B]|uniref:Uncharacterized protein n=1 Tax=Ceriporiopsis subvermispora (strain B) TaxID=914234 RepID=M2QZ62_CERS8|nr:hypothetical protein CERSUDRAFT_100572 [Gelatoporia subvermispora B]